MVDEQVAADDARARAFSLTPAHWSLWTAYCYGVADAFRAVRVPATKPNEILVCLTASIVDGLAAVGSTAASPGNAHAPTIVRSMLDAYVDFRLLLQSDDYLYELKHRDLTGERRTCAGLAASHPRDEPALAYRIEHLDECIRLADLQLAELRARGVHVRKMEQRLAAAKLPPQVAAAYHHLTASTHNDVSMLARRHIRDGRIVFWEGLTDQQKGTAMQAAGTIALCAVSELAVRITSGDVEMFTALRSAGPHLIRFGEMMPKPAAPTV